MYKKIGLPYLPGKIRSLISPVSPTLIERASQVGTNLSNSLAGLKCYLDFCKDLVFVDQGWRCCPSHGKLKCGNQIKRWGYCELPWGHSGSCEYERVKYSYGGDDRSPYGPD